MILKKKVMKSDWLLTPLPYLEHNTVRWQHPSVIINFEILQSKYFY